MIPDGETRRIETFPVFCVTMVFSVFAYIWLLIILVVHSPNKVEVWEAAVTLAFAVCVAVAVIAVFADAAISIVVAPFLPRLPRPPLIARRALNVGTAPFAQGQTELQTSICRSLRRAWPRRPCVDTR